MSDDFLDVRQAAVLNREQLVRLIEQEIDALRLRIADYPGPHSPLNGELYIVWERRVMMDIGGVQKLLKAFRALDLLPAELAIRLQTSAMAVLNQAMAQIAMGNRS